MTRFKILATLALLLLFAQHGRAQWPYVPIVQSKSTSLNAAS
jgi:hypothetical protein